MAVTKSPFLVGNRFSRADLTAAALLSPTLAQGRTLELMRQAFPPIIRQ